jgi:hypothetical protein
MSLEKYKIIGPIKGILNLKLLPLFKLGNLF